MITLDNLEKITSNVVPVIGHLGGRKFHYSSQSYSMNELYKHLLEHSNPTIDQAPQIERILTHLQKKDQEGQELLNQSNLLIRILTAIRRVFGSSLNRNYVREKLEPLIREFDKRDNLINAIRQINLPAPFNPETIGRFARNNLSLFKPSSRVKGLCANSTRIHPAKLLLFLKGKRPTH